MNDKCVFLMIFSLGFLAGCEQIYGPHGIVQDSSSNYIESKSVPRLDLPNDYSRNKIEDYYVVPSSGRPMSASYIQLQPPGSFAEKVHPKDAVPRHAETQIHTDPNGDTQLLWQMDLGVAWNQATEVLANLDYQVTHENKSLKIIYFVVPSQFKRKGQLYQLHLRQVMKERTALWLTDPYGKSVPLRQANKILEKINREYSDSQSGTPDIVYR